MHSIILGLAITRLLGSVAVLVRAHRRVTFHWATALWGACVMLLHFNSGGWVDWELRTFSDWTILIFFALVTGAIFICGAAELSLPTEDCDIPMIQSWISWRIANRLAGYQQPRC